LTIFETGILQKESENIIFLMQCSTDPPKHWLPSVLVRINLLVCALFT
jgi:hypothetical protein